MPLVRTTNYGDPDSAQRILAFSAAGYPLLVIVPFGKGYGPVGAGMTLQIDNEPDVQSPAVSPEQYGQTFRSTMEAMRHTLPSSIPIVTAGFSNSATVDWIERALVAGASDADAVCFHVYGDDLVEAFTARLTAVTEAMAAAGCTKPLWITEVAPTAYNAAGAIAIHRRHGIARSSHRSAGRTARVRRCSRSAGARGRRGRIRVVHLCAVHRCGRRWLPASDQHDLSVDLDSRARGLPIRWSSNFDSAMAQRSYDL